MRQGIAEMFEGTLAGPWVDGDMDAQYRVDNGVLYLQPSMSDRDWAINLLFGTIPYKNMEEEYSVHAGFFLAYKANAEAIQKLDFDTIAGTSLGAAIGVHVHEDRLFRTGKQPDTHLFACPCAIDKASKNVLSRWSNVTRYSTPRDLVAFAFRILGYQHVGNLVTLTNKVKRPKDVGLLRWLSGHSMEEYRMRLAGQ